jgi:protein-S-isoprenylcysteine O-methyltransferase Ste14
MVAILEAIGYYAAAVVVSSMPPALLYWYLIHPFAAAWRRLGKAPTFFVVGAICLALVAWLFTLRARFLAVHWGYHWALAVPGAALYLLAVLGERRIRRQLKLPILVGARELDAGSPGQLMTDGIYARSRNPRYVNIVVALAGIALILNYPAVYLVTLGMIPGLFVLVLFEERELAERFGREYLDYCDRVPRFLPKSGWIV